ncbi:MAG: hypothetical protein EXQ74_06870 [Thermoleophilia bacterium]|nr:hypothetical protein [Thermoleophilia bacterium]
MTPRLPRRPRAPREPRRAEWVRVAIAANQPEGEMIQGILTNAQIPSYLRRNGAFDVPDMLAGGPRDIMVPGDRAREAQAALDPLGDEEGRPELPSSPSAGTGDPAGPTGEA